MNRILSTVSLAVLLTTGCDEAQLAQMPLDTGLQAGSLCRVDDDGQLGCVNVESSFTMNNTDTLCWKGTWGAYLFAMPVNGVCPAGYNGPIGTNQNPANRWTLCGLAEIMTPAPGACASGCTDKGVQVNHAQTATTCKATRVRICSPTPAATDADDSDE